MRFTQPYAGYIFIAILGLIAFYLWSFRMRKTAMERFAKKELLRELLVFLDPFKQKLKVVLLIMGTTFCLFALMRPQWGFRWEEVKRKGVDILIAFDTSKSMLAADIKPNRLERAKLAIGDFCSHLKSDRVGLIAFAGSAFLQCPLTIDYDGFLLALKDIDTNTIPRGGTSISSAIKEALRSFPEGQKKYKVLIIITDGEDHEGDPLRTAQEAKKEGVVIFCIGIGTEEGELISVEEERKGREFLKDNEGNVVKSRLNEEVLQKIAMATGGTYARSTRTEFGLDLLYRSRISQMEKRELESKMNKLYEERFQIPLGLGLLLILLEAIISDSKNKKK